jgi:two-component system LytT family sensor kinase
MGDLNGLDAGRRGRLAAIIACACVVAALVTSAQLYLPQVLGQKPGRAWVVLSFELLEWVMWGLLVPVIWRIDARWGFRSRPWPRALALHLALALAWFGLQNLIMVGLPLGEPESGYQGMTLGDAYAVRFILRLPSALSVYAAIVAAGYWAWWFAEYHQREAQRAQLEAQLAAARLRALRMQLQPHFLFNTLHTIAAHVREGERDTAVDLIARLSRLLRRTLDEADRQEVPLADEVNLVAEYLALERARFGDTLVTRFEIAAEVRDVPVPSLVLQPLVENAIRHGLGGREGQGELRISARRDDGRLVLEVADNGVGYDTSRAGSGLGLANTRERLAQLYGQRQRFEIGPGSQGGTVARVEIPLERAGRHGD